MCPTIQSADRNPFQFFSAQFAVISETGKWLGVPIYITNNRYVRQRTPRKVWPKLVCWWNRCQDIWPWYYLSQTINHNGNLAACRWNHKRDFVSPSWTPHTSAISRDAFSLGSATPESCLCKLIDQWQRMPLHRSQSRTFHGRGMHCQPTYWLTAQRVHSKKGNLMKFGWLLPERSSLPCLRLSSLFCRSRITDKCQQNW